MRLLKSHDIRLSLAAILIASGALTGCAFSKDADKPTTVEDPAVKKMVQDQDQLNKETKAGEISESEVKTVFDEVDKEPNQYNMTVTWPADVALVDLGIDDVFYKNLKKNSYTVPVTGGDSIKIHLETMNSKGDPVTEIDILAVAPIDFVLGKDRTGLSHDLSLHGKRLFIYHDEPIVMNANNVDIDVDEIISDDGRFDSFNDHEIDSGQTSDEKKLKNSNIVIKAKKIDGRLTFNLDGLNGKDGLDGSTLEKQSHFQEAKNGTDGSNGSAESNDRPCTTEHCFQGLLCANQPGNGADGESGHDGTAGEPGSNGGNTGNITVITEDYSTATVQIGYSIGQGGKGGKGAPGHKGGSAGKAGTAPKPCNQQTVSGRPGINGRPGLDGKDGEQGAVGAFIVPQGPAAQTHFLIINANTVQK